MSYKESKWARSIIERQTKDGLWNGYHNLSIPRKNTDTMEENLRRLEILGYTYEDEPIKKTITYLEENLAGRKPMLDCNGSPMVQDFFVDLINAAWIRRFTKECDAANAIALRWAELYSEAFQNGAFDRERYAEKYRQLFDAEPFRWAAQKQRNFYDVSLISDVLDEKTEECFIDCIMKDPKGIYYMYQKCIAVLPEQFQSKETVSYLSTIYVLLRYERSRYKFTFVKDWIMEHQYSEGMWDLGSQAKDGIIFPLSDDWKSEENRVKDCSWFMNQILKCF